MIIIGFPATIMAGDIRAIMDLGSEIISWKKGRDQCFHFDYDFFWMLDDIKRGLDIKKTLKAEDLLKKVVSKNSSNNHTAWDKLIELSHTKNRAKIFTECIKSNVMQESFDTLRFCMRLSLIKY